MTRPIKILLLEDQLVDAELLRREFLRAELDAEVRHVTSERDFLCQLDSFAPDIILSDYRVPGFDGPAALAIACEKAPDTPFIFVSGSIGEERAIEALQQGATDYIIKDRLTRLPSAILRACQEAAKSREKRRADSVLAYRVAFHQAISRIAANFINLPAKTIDSAIDEGLARVGELTSVDLCSLFLLRDGETTIDNTHEWVRSGVASQKERLHQLSSAQYPWLFQTFHTAGPVYIPNTRDLPAEADAERKILELQGVRTVLALPMFLEQAPLGLISFKSVRAPKVWSDDDIELVRIVAAIFANAIGRKRQFEALTDLTRRHEMILDSAAEGIYGIDLEGRVTFINPAAARMLGFAADELLGQSMHEKVHHTKADGTPYPAEQCPIYATLHDGKIRSNQREVFWRKGGQPCPVELSCSPIFGSEIQGAVVTFSDISKRLMLEEQFERQKRISSLGQLATTIAHEFNNVLMGIQPFAEVILRSNDADRTRNAATQIFNSVKRGKRITEDILRFTRPAEMLTSEIDVATWLVTFAGEMRGMIRKDIELDVEIPPPGLTIAADPTQLHQVFTNLVLNARDAIVETGAIRIRASQPAPEVEYPFGIVARPERFVHFTISDTGSGIAPDAIKRIFEPLFTTKHRGTGLGLSVTHQVVTAHGGHIFVESAVGEGTTFHLFLPRPNGNGV